MTAVQQFWLVPIEQYLVSTPYPLLVRDDAITGSVAAVSAGTLPVDDTFGTGAALSRVEVVPAVPSHPAVDDTTLLTAAALTGVTTLGSAPQFTADDENALQTGAALQAVTIIPLPQLDQPWDTGDNFSTGAAVTAVVTLV